MRLANLLGSVALATSSLTMPGATARAEVAQPADFQAQAEAILDAAYPAEGPGAAAIVTRHGRIVYAAGRGLADVAAHRPITPDTVFGLGSLTKQFTAAIVLQLVREGSLSLDDPISRFFPDWPQPGARATVRQLLNHTSGLQDYSKIPGWIARNRGRSFTTAELLALMKSLPAKAEPGQKWEYNNGGYVVLGAIVEKVTGKPWYRAVEERIARPLDLPTIAYDGSGKAGSARARGYTEREGRAQPAEGADMSVAHAAGGLAGSVRDLARWAQALHHTRVVDAALYRQMIQPARLADGSTAPYGFALRLRTLLGRPVLAHGGARAGFRTESIYIPSEDLFVAIFANSDRPATDADIVARRLTALALGTPIPSFRHAEVDPQTIEPLFGRYGDGRHPEFRFFARGGRYYVATGPDELELEPAGGDRFFAAGGGLAWAEFARGADGAQSLTLHDPAKAEAEHYVRLGPIPADAEVTVPAEVLRSYAGTYQTETVAVTVALGENGWLTLQPTGGPVLPMRPVSQTEFRIDRNPMRVVFQPEGGAVNRLTIYRGARELHGVRTEKQHPSFR